VASIPPVRTCASVSKRNDGAQRVLLEAIPAPDVNAIHYYGACRCCLSLAVLIALVALGLRMIYNYAKEGRETVNRAAAQAEPAGTSAVLASRSETIRGQAEYFTKVVDRSQGMPVIFLLHEGWTGRALDAWVMLRDAVHATDRRLGLACLDIADPRNARMRADFILARARSGEDVPALGIEVLGRSDGSTLLVYEHPGNELRGAVAGYVNRAIFVFYGSSALPAAPAVLAAPTTMPAARPATPPALSAGWQTEYLREVSERLSSEDPAVSFGTLAEVERLLQIARNVGDTDSRRSCRTWRNTG